MCKQEQRNQYQEETVYSFTASVSQVRHKHVTREQQHNESTDGNSLPVQQQYGGQYGEDVPRRGGGNKTLLIAGGAFAVVAIIGRSVADESLPAMLLSPLTWLMIVAALVGQSCLAVALQRGTATSSVAAMDATTVVLTSVVGIGMLGDRISPGWEWAVGFGMTLVVAGVLVLGSPSRTTAEVAG